MMAVVLACAVGFSMLSVQGLDPLFDDDSGKDPDGDGLTNIMEYVYGTDPYDSDTDNGGAPDGWEACFDQNRAVFAHDSAMARFDSDGDGFNEVNVDPDCRFDPTNGADEYDFPDSDGWNNLREFYAGTDPTNPDTDGDYRDDDIDPEPLVPHTIYDYEWANCGPHPVSGQSGGEMMVQGVDLAPVLAGSWYPCNAGNAHATGNLLKAETFPSPGAFNGIRAYGGAEEVPGESA
jgi:hypothetical protein